MFWANKSQKGSATVEAAILAPIVIMSIIAVIYIGILLCERCSIQAAADTASEAGSAGWRHFNSDAETGKMHIDEIKTDGLYWRIIDSRKKLKSEKAAESAYNYRYGQLVAKPENKLVSAEMIDYVIYKKLSVKLEQEYSVPVPGFFYVFGMTDKLTINTASASVVNDSAELIRNTDFIIDLEKELEKRNPAIKDIGDKTRSAIQKIKEKVNSF